MGLGGFEIGHKLHGGGIEMYQETMPSGEIVTSTKYMVKLYGITFERTNKSNGGYTNEMKVGESFFRSLFLGVKLELNFSIFKESYIPNK